jgi:spore coat protein U-like protein
MRHATDVTEFIPYSLSLSPTTGTGSGPATPITLTIDGSILNADYVNALAGNYSDTVVLTITP